MGAGIGDADILFSIDDDVVAGFLLDPVQNSFPWYEGALVEGPALVRWRRFLDIFHEADLEFDYCPYHPDQGPYEDSDLAAYVRTLTALRDARAAGRPADENECWTPPWHDAPLAELDAYLAFLGWRRWRATTKNGGFVEGVPLPPSLDMASRRYAYRPGVDTRRYDYVGPEPVRVDAATQPAGALIQSREALLAWLDANPEGHADAATFVVDTDAVLRLAPRRSEHVACAGGGRVYAAGEVAFTRDGSGVRWCSNQSSGYCPEPSCMAPLSWALAAAGVRPPTHFDLECTWRRCPSCAQTNLVKEGDYTCAACGAKLPQAWNFADGE